MQDTNRQSVTKDDLCIACKFAALGLIAAPTIFGALIFAYVVKSAVGIKLTEGEGPLHQLVWVPLTSALGLT